MCVFVTVKSCGSDPSEDDRAAASQGFNSKTYWKWHTEIVGGEVGRHVYRKEKGHALAVNFLEPGFCSICCRGRLYSEHPDPITPSPRAGRCWRPGLTLPGSGFLDYGKIAAAIQISPSPVRPSPPAT